MLVFSKRRHGGPVINNTPIPGYLDMLPPAIIPYDLYKIYKRELRLAPYTKVWLENTFGGNFPDITFSFNELRYLSHSDLVALCNAFSITSPARKSTVKRLAAIRRFLEKHG